MKKTTQKAVKVTAENIKCAGCVHCVKDPKGESPSGYVCDRCAPLLYAILSVRDIVGPGPLNCQHGKPCTDRETAPAPAPVVKCSPSQAKASNEAIKKAVKDRAARIGIDPDKVVVSTVPTKPEAAKSAPEAAKPAQKQPEAPAAKPAAPKSAPQAPKGKETGKGAKNAPAAPKSAPAKPEAKKPAAKKPEAKKKAPAFDSYKGSLAGWRKLTDDNNHDEVRAQIATWAAVQPTPEADFKELSRCLDVYASIACIHETIGHAVKDLLTLRVKTDSAFFAAIKNAMGAEIEKDLRSCL